MDFNLIFESDEMRRFLKEMNALSSRVSRAPAQMARLGVAPPHAAYVAMPWAKDAADDIESLLKPSLTSAEVQRLDLIDEAGVEKAVQDIARRMLDNADRRLFGVGAHAYIDEEEPSLTLDAIEEAMAELKAMGPFPTELWFVDCRDLYVAFTNSLPYKRVTRVTHSDIGAGTMFSLDMRVIEWYMRHFDEENETIARKDEGPEERQRLRDEHGYEHVWPWFVAIPGIWVRMSDGSAKRIGPHDEQRARFSKWMQQSDAE